MRGWIQQLEREKETRLTSHWWVRWIAEEECLAGGGGAGVASLLLASPVGGQEARMVYRRATGHNGSSTGAWHSWHTELCKWKRKPPGVAKFSKVPASGFRAF